MSHTPAEPAIQPFLEVRNVTKTFGEFVALDGVSLTINEGEFICFLGPSGCGKTTLLRAIAGLDFQTSGQIIQRGVDVSDFPPGKRDFGIVFQSYALFPNLTVAKNVGYGLASQKMPTQQIAARVQELLELVGLPDAGSKYPAALSGGQQQRIALARALATSPGMLLLDEPLSALDAKVRERLRHEMKDLQQRLGVTTIMVTHDQEEALSMADRIVVMNHGVIDQIGTPMEIYRHPANAYVADFIGAMNFMPGVLRESGVVEVGNISIFINGQHTTLAAGDQVLLCIRPEDVQVRDLGDKSENRCTARVEDIDFLGSFCRATLHFDEAPEVTLRTEFSINLMRDLNIAPNSEMTIALPRNRLRLFAASGAHG